MHLVDITIVCISLALEILALTLHERVTEIGGLLVIFRLWRVVRVMHAVGDVQHHVDEEHMRKLERTNAKLREVDKAHHSILKAIHAEYTERVRLSVIDYFF
jgi:voltage-gated hydrogen channel 1